MNYKLTKKLKDAGFPQKDKNQYPLYIKEYNEEPMQVPILPELIEACGYDFINLERNKFSIKKWKAVGITKNTAINDFDNSKEINEFGSTPEEAVANLYLNLKR